MIQRCKVVTSATLVCCCVHWRLQWASLLCWFFCSLVLSFSLSLLLSDSIHRRVLVAFLHPIHNRNPASAFGRGSKRRSFFFLFFFFFFSPPPPPPPPPLPFRFNDFIQEPLPKKYYKMKWIKRKRERKWWRRELDESRCVRQESSESKVPNQWVTTPMGVVKVYVRGHDRFAIKSKNCKCSS